MLTIPGLLDSLFVADFYYHPALCYVDSTFINLPVIAIIAKLKAKLLRWFVFFPAPLPPFRQPPKRNDQ